MLGRVLNALSTYIDQYTQSCATDLHYHTPKQSSNNIQYQILIFGWKFKEILKFPCPTSLKCHGHESYSVILKNT